MRAHLGSRLAIAGLFYHAHVRTAEGATINPDATTSAPSLTTAISSSSTATLSLTSLITNTHSGTIYTFTELRLPISTAAPDPIGFSNVSGFYGPGAWAAWFLTVCASWIRILSGTKGIDTNLWFYLLGTNWAAKDVIQHVMKVQSLGGIDASGSMKEMAQIGAAYVVLWWGVAAALPQMLIAGLHASDDRSNSNVWKRRQHLIPLVIGLLLPGVALVVVLYTATSWPIPALYYTGCDPNSQQRVFIAIGITGIHCLLSVAVSAFICLFEQLPSHWDAWNTYRNWMFKTHSLAYMCGTTVTAVLFGFLCRFAKPWYTVWVLIPFLPGYYLVSIIFLYVTFFVASIPITAYILLVGITFDLSTISQSCVFMPCAPQSISDSDQAFSLLAGLVLLVGAEILPVLWKMRKNRIERRINRQVLQEAGDRLEIEMARRIDSGLTRTPTSGLYEANGNLETEMTRRTNFGVMRRTHSGQETRWYQ